jgi:hypothetical protein
MEGIERDERLGEEFDEDGEDEENLIYTVDAKMGSEELKVRDTIYAIAKPYMMRTDLDKENNKEMSLVEQKISLEIRNVLNEKYGGCWGAIVGNRFSMGIGLKETDRFANYKIGIFNIVVFQYNNYE